MHIHLDKQTGIANEAKYTHMFDLETQVHVHEEKQQETMHNLWEQYPQDKDHSNMHQMCGIKMNHAATAGRK